MKCFYGFLWKCVLFDTSNVIVYSLPSESLIVLFCIVYFVFRSFLSIPIN